MQTGLKSFAAVAAILLLAACGSAKVTGSGTSGPMAAAPTVIYVEDFELDSDNVQQQGISGAISNIPRPGLIGSGPLGLAKSPQAQAREIVETMSKNLREDLEKKGLNAVRLPPGSPLPATGWLVRGVFTQVDTGSRVRRAVIGFGAGGVNMQVMTAIDDLSRGGPKQFYSVDTSAQSGKLPGAAITMNPYMAAARFVMAGQDADKAVKNTAEKIAEDVSAKVATASR